MIIQASGIAAFLFSILTPVIFISIIYIGMPRRARRDDPAEIKRRATILGIMTAVWPIVVTIIWGDWNARPELSVFAWFGVKIDINTLLGTLGAVLTAVMLFLGPLSQLAIRFSNGFPDFKLNILSVRAYILAPIYEEVLFRGCVTTVLLSSGWTPGWTILWSSFVFGFSHIHHIRDPEIPPAATIAQVCYCTLFSLYTNDLFVSTSSLYGCILAHAFWNFMGLPDFSFFILGNPDYKYKWGILLFYITGIFGFFVSLPILNDPVLHNSLHYFLHKNL